MAEELIPTPAPPDPPKTAAHCPECGADFDGISVTHASETLAALREENSTLKKELAAEKEKHAQPDPAPATVPPAPAAPEPQPEAKKRRYSILGKRAAA